MAKYIYWVKLERFLFRKPEWSVKLNDQMIALCKDREAAMMEAVTDAERSSLLGRASEIWVDEGQGFTLYKSFKVTKPEVVDEDEEESTHDDGLDDTSYL